LLSFQVFDFGLLWSWIRIGFQTFHGIALYKSTFTYLLTYLLTYTGYISLRSHAAYVRCRIWPLLLSSSRVCLKSFRMFSRGRQTTIDLPVRISSTEGFCRVVTLSSFY